MQAVVPVCCSGLVSSAYAIGTCGEARPASNKLSSIIRLLFLVVHFFSSFCFGFVLVPAWVLAPVMKRIFLWRSHSLLLLAVLALALP